MRSLSSRERRLLMLLLVAGFIILNFLGYQTLAQRRTAALSQQRALRFDIARLKELQTVKPVVDINSEWVDKHLPAYADIDQLETYLFNVVTNKAMAADVELTKKDPRPTQKDALVHRSIMEIEATAEMENLITFLHSLQGKEDFRFISFLEMMPTKDEERVRCQARIEQWWRPDSEELAGIVSSDVPRLPDVPVTTPPPTTDTKPPVTADPPPAPSPSAGDGAANGAPPAASPDEITAPAVEQPSGETVQPPVPPPDAATPAE
jgi:hypothetical protein